jgi:glycosyltransferase involved in cell wall biosynthesis
LLQQIQLNIRDLVPMAAQTALQQQPGHNWLAGDQSIFFHVAHSAVRELEVLHDQLLALLHRADAAVLPSHYEPFGIVALEAIAAGTPLVTTNVGGLGEAVIDGLRTPIRAGFAVLASLSFMGSRQ